MFLPLALSIALGAGLLGLALRTNVGRRRAPALPPPLTSSPPTTVLLPVRDERHHVLACVETLLAQSGSPRVRVADDGSTDGTAALVAARAAGEPRLQALSAGPLPSGWRGKVHALWKAWQDVDTPWVLLTDADTRHAPDLLARAHAAAAERRLAAISIAGLQEALGLGENLLIPPVFAALDALLGDWRQVAAGAGPAVANGQFILLRREAWDSCGGFAAIRGEPIDDVAMVNRLRAGGFATGFFRSAGLRIRMYHGWTETVRGWRRNLGGLFGPLPARSNAVLTVLVLPAAVLLGLPLGGFWPVALLLWAGGAAASALLRSGSGHQPWYGLLYPLDALLLAAVLGLGILDHRRGKLMSWKGREIRA